MKNRIIPAALLVVVFVVGSSFAQDWYHQRERAFAGDNWRPQLFSQVRSDLDHIYSAQFAGGHENQRIQQTKDRLSRLQDDMDHGRDDNNLLNDVVNEMENTAKDNRLAPRDREVVYRTVGRWLKGVYPVSTGIVVSALARPEWLVEVDVIAVIPDEE